MGESQIVLAPEEWQNGDIHLARHIAAVASYHIGHASSYPEGMTPEGWQSVLVRIAEPLIAYADGKFEFDSAQEREAVTAATSALHLFAENFNALWD